jgi:hypothetical protein
MLNKGELDNKIYERTLFVTKTLTCTFYLLSLIYMYDLSRRNPWEELCGIWIMIFYEFSYYLWLADRFKLQGFRYYCKYHHYKLKFQRYDSSKIGEGSPILVLAIWER